MCDRQPVPADAYSPDADRAGRGACAPPPEWVVAFVARLLLFVLRHLAAFRQRGVAPTPSWWMHVPEYAPGSTQAYAAALRGPFGNLITTMCWLDGIGPGHQDWGYISRTILAFGGSLKPLDGHKHPRPWWNSREILPGMFDGLPEQPIAASPLAQRLAADALSPVPAPERAAAAHAPADEACLASTLLPAFWRRVLARAGTGPPVRGDTGPPIRAGTDPPTHACVSLPIGPPANPDQQFCCA
jgi:hypothetical protein